MIDGFNLCHCDTIKSSKHACRLNLRFGGHSFPLKTLLKFSYGDMVRYDPTIVDLTSNFFVLCINVKVYLYHYS